MKKINIELSSWISSATYCGQDALDFYSKALLIGGSKETFKQYPNVKNTIKLNKIDLANIIQSDSCSFSASGTVSFGQKELTPCAVKVNLEICKEDIEQEWMAALMRAGASGSEVLPAELESYLMDEVTKHINAAIERVVWQGDTTASPADWCDGLVKKMLADGTVIDVNNTTLSASNIITELAKVYAAIPATIINSPNLVIYISTAAMKFFRTAVANASAETYVNKVAELSYLGIPLIVAPGMADDVMVATTTSNLVLATDLMSDTTEVKFVNMTETTLDQSVRIGARFRIGVDFVYGAEVVLYS